MLIDEFGFKKMAPLGLARVPAEPAGRRCVCGNKVDLIYRLQERACARTDPAGIILADVGGSAAMGEPRL